MSEIYRDPTDGATAKRQDLLRRRRDELATMPHAIRRVVVARVARASAGLGLTIGGLALLVFASSPQLTAAFDRVLPGVKPAGASTILCGTWLLALAAYMISRARSEHRFAVAMSRYVLPGDDLDHDLQRLDHEHPDEVARGMAHRREVASAAWPVLGAALAVPAILMYVAQAIRQRGWPVMTDFEHALGSHGSLFVAYGVAGVIGALAMTRRPTRAPGALNALVAIAFAGIIAAIAIRSMALGGLAVVPIAMTLLVRRLRIERAAIAAHDPAAGSELFSFREVLRATWAKARVIGRYAGAPATLRTTVALVLVAGGWHYLHRAKPAAPLVPVPTDVITPFVTPVVPVDDHADPIKQTVHDGAIRVNVDLAGEPVELHDLGGLAMVPHGWSAAVDVNVICDKDVDVTPFLGREPVRVKVTQHFEASACSSPVKLGLRVVPTRPEPYHVTLLITPTLAPTSCP